MMVMCNVIDVIRYGRRKAELSNAALHVK